MDKEEKSIELASEAIKQQIALASAIIGVTVAFGSSVDKQTTLLTGIWSKLPYAFIPLVMVIIFGVIAIQSISYYLKENQKPLSKCLVRVCGILQNVFFIISFIYLVYILFTSTS